MKPYYRSMQSRKLGGVCGGMGELLDVDPRLIRLGFVFLCLATGFFPLIITYLITCLVIPAGQPEAVVISTQPLSSS